MALSKLFLQSFKPATPLHILPELRAAMLADVTNRYTNEIEPATWKAFSEDSDKQYQFLNATSAIVDSVIDDFISKGKLAKLSDIHREHLQESLWYESQAFWYAHIEELRLVFSFVEKMLASASNEIQGLFPDSQRVFGPLASALLTDLAFQHELWGYARVAKPDLVDLRRMINISGQIVESIFYSKIFNEDLQLVKILVRLKGLRDQGNPERREFLDRFPKGTMLQSKDFLSSLDKLRELRNAYSHGGSSQEVTDDNLRDCVVALLDDKVGLLPRLYELLQGLE